MVAPSHWCSPASASPPTWPTARASTTRTRTLFSSRPHMSHRLAAATGITPASRLTTSPRRPTLLLQRMPTVAIAGKQVQHLRLRLRHSVPLADQVLHHPCGRRQPHEGLRNEQHVQQLRAPVRERDGEEWPCRCLCHQPRLRWAGDRRLYRQRQDRDGPAQPEHRNGAFRQPERLHRRAPYGCRYSARSDVHAGPLRRTSLTTHSGPVWCLFA